MDEDQLLSLLFLVENENVWPLVKNSWPVSSWQQQSFKPSMEPFQAQALCKVVCYCEDERQFTSGKCIDYFLAHIRHSKILFNSCLLQNF